MHPAFAFQDICPRKRFPMNPSRHSAAAASPNSPDGARSESSDSDVRQDDNGKRGSVRALMALNFCIADVQNGMGPYVALFLQSWVGWGPAQIGTALAAGNLAQVFAQTPAGALIDKLRQKRALLSVGIVMIAAACLATVWLTTPAGRHPPRRRSSASPGAIFPAVPRGGGVGPGGAQAHGPANGHQPSVQRGRQHVRRALRWGPSVTTWA